MKNFHQVECLSEVLLEELFEMYQHEWWTRGRALDDVREAVRNSSVVVALVTQDGNLAAFTRVLSDGVFKALIFDVIVRAEYRTLGLGKTLIESVLRHPFLARVRSFELYCRPELSSFYSQFGFSLDVGEIHLMRYSPSDAAPTTPGQR